MRAYVLQPPRIDDLRQALEKSFALELYLAAQAEMGDEVYVFDPVLLRNGDVGTVGEQFDRVRRAAVCRSVSQAHIRRFQEVLTINVRREVEGQVLDVAGVVFQKDEALVQHWIQGRQIVQVSLFPQPLWSESVK